jgi:hypothetical protein
VPEYLVAIAEGPKTNAGELDLWPRWDLEKAGFREDGQIAYDEAMARGDEAFAEIMKSDDDAIRLDAPAFRRIVFRYEAESAEQGATDMRVIVGENFNIRAVKA